MSDNIMSTLVLLFAILYLISPVDGCPGPIDDLIVIMMALAARRNLRN